MKAKERRAEGIMYVKVKKMDLRYALAALILFGFAFAGLSISGYSVSPAVVEPGSSGFLQITLSNGAATDTVESVSITVSSAEALGIDRTFVVGDLEAGSSVMVSLPFSASEDISGGYYSVEIKATGRAIEYYYTSDGTMKSKTETFEKRASVPVQVVEQPVLSVELSEDSLEDLTDATLTITNNGGTAKRIEVTILNEGVGFLGSGKLYVESMNGEASLDATIDARGADEGATKLQFRLSYQNGLGTQINETIEVPVTIKKTEGDFVFVQDGAIVTGENDEMQLNLTNEGKGISDVRFTFGTEEVRLRGLNEFVVGDLESGETVQLSVPLVADLEPGTQNVELQMSWEESGENRVGTVTIPVEVVSDAAIGVYLEAKTTPLTSGSENTLSVTVSNLGTYDIQGTTVRLESAAFSLDTIQPEQFIGELESDDYSSVQYDIAIGRVSSGEYPAKVTVTFRDASGSWVSVEREIPITINGMSLGGGENVSRGGGLSIPVIAGTVIVGGAAYWLWKKRKKPGRPGAGGS